MSKESIVNAAKEYFTVDVGITMVAIAGAESGWQDNAEGDNLSAFTPVEQSNYADFAIDGWLSFGPWQIFLGVHTSKVEAAAQTTDKEELKSWLFNAKNNALIARQIYDSQGFSAWSTFNNGAYKEHLAEATAAWNAATGANIPTPGAAIVAFSVNGDVVHFDLSDGSFLEARTNHAGQFGGWLRRDLAEPVNVQLTLPTA